VTATDLLHSAQSGLAVHLFTVGGTRITIGTIVAVVLILLAGVWGSRLVRSAIRRAFKLRGVTDAGTTLMVQRLANYSIMAVAIMSAFQTIGIDLDALLAAGAVFAVGFGLAMQSIAQNFVSGVILLVERSIRPGDVLEVDGQMVQVEELTVRNTVVRTLDDDQLIVPNAVLAQGTVRNFTKRDSTYRLRVPVGVAYASDVPAVFAALEGAGQGMAWRKAGVEPEVLFMDYGESALIFELSVWTETPWQALRQRSAMRTAVWRALHGAGITIAFPQLDVHLDVAKVGPGVRVPLS
jgi:potassium-dependent mechanosensitive channel